MKIKRNRLVTNDSKTLTSNTLQRVVSNFRSNVREETFEGRRYLVAPMVMLVEGVHEGSQGPILYLNEEIAKTPAVWNHKPVVVYHPKDGAGQDISACHPDVLVKYKVGLIFNARHEGNKLKAEAWLDIERLKQVPEGEQILMNIRGQRITEISTGIFGDFDLEQGDWNGEFYTAVIRNMKPDHLAILPNEVGACSVADGAGLLRNNSESDKDKERNMERQKQVDALVANERTPWEEDDRDFLMGVEDVRFQKIIANVDEDDDEESEEDSKPAAVANANANKVRKVTRLVKDSANEDPKTPEELERDYIANAPPRLRSVFQRSLARDAKVHKELVDKILANKRSKFTKDQLEAMDIDQLEPIAELCEPVQKYAQQTPALNNYMGLSEAFRTHQPTTVNVQGGNDKVTEEPLEVPALFPEKSE